MENCNKCGIECYEKELDGDYLFMLCKNCISEYDVLTLKEFQKSKETKDLKFMEKYFGFGYEYWNNKDSKFLVYGGNTLIGYIEIANHKDGKYFLNISNWDGLTDNLEDFEKKLYTDHYICQL